jgi:hypothetical protein
MKAPAEYAEGREVDDNDQPNLKSHVVILTVAFISVPVPSTTIRFSASANGSEAVIVGASFRLQLGRLYVPSNGLELIAERVPLDFLSVGPRRTDCAGRILHQW